MPAAPGRTGAWKCCTLSSMGRWTRTPVGSALRRVPWVRCGGWPIASSPTCAARCRSDGLPSACGPIRRGCWRSAQPADSQRINLKCYAPALYHGVADVEVQLVADPGFGEAFAVALGPDVARGRQLGEHGLQRLLTLPFQARRRLGVAPLVLARATALGFGCLRRRRVGRVALRLLARLDPGRIARHMAEDVIAQPRADQLLMDPLG